MYVHGLLISSGIVLMRVLLPIMLIIGSKRYGEYCWKIRKIVRNYSINANVG